MKQRIITAIVSLAVFVPIVYAGSWILDMVIALLAIIGLFELFRMKGIAFFSLEGLIAVIGLLLILLPQYWETFIPAHYTVNSLFYFCGLLLLVCTVFSKNQFTFDDAAVAIFGSMYIGYGFKYFLAARSEGLGILLLVLFVIWSNDIGAYSVGRKIGKTKLAPNISPNKTIEGSIGGIVSALAVSFVMYLFYPLDISAGWLILLVFVISVAGQVGDLIESAFKRHYGVKDSGKLLPGHGGILDRFDSMLVVLPVIHLLTII